MTRCLSVLILLTFFTKGSLLWSQKISDSLQQASLQTCIQYALQHQPIIQQSLIDERITEYTIKSKLADWYPQINFDYFLQHYFQLPTIYFQGNPVKQGVINSSAAEFSLTQNIFNRDVLLASQTAKDVRTQIKQITSGNKIDVVVNVSKAFYDVLLTQQQIKLLNEDIIRLERSLKDAYNQYQGGIVDKTDYKRATISLNNARAEKKQTEELLKAKYAYLKQQMSYEAVNNLQLIYDSTQMEKDAFIDTTQNLNYNNRIEYQLLQTQKSLQQANLKYYKWSFIPSLSAYGNYNLNYFNNSFSKLYSASFPNSYAGLTLTFPLFQGNKRIYQIRQAELELKRVDYDVASLINSINTEYTQALATYTSNLNNYNILKENLDLALDVYNTIELQYKAGVKTYLDVIIAQTDLRSTQVNYTNALYQLLSSKLDVQKALGNIQY
ncbi:MAG: TolC family protein [Chitinophagaceae bacterium]